MPIRFPDGELGRWVSLGGVTERAVRVWMRSPSGETETATLEIGGVERGAVALTPSPEHDWTAAADLVLDEPAPNAAFTVRLGDLQRQGQFAPPPNVPTAFSFGFGSCHQPFAPPKDGTLTLDRGAEIYRPMREALAAYRARFLALIGDQVYSDGVEPIDVRQAARDQRPEPTDAELREQYRWLYRGHFNVTGFRALLENQPTIMTWDDHDITEGWGSLLDVDPLDERIFRAAEATYREYQHVRHVGASVDDSAPYHRAFWFGDVGFFVLDLRGVRSYRHGRLLGERQWADLEAFVDEATQRETPTIFLLAGIPIVHHSPAFVRLLEWVPSLYATDLRDRWSAEPIKHERTRLLELLLDWQAARPARQVAVLSGDVHAGAVFRLRRPGRAGLIHQWTSSPLSTQPSFPEHLANVLGTRLVNLGEDRYHSTRAALVQGNNFGLVQVTPASGGHQLELTLYAHISRSRVRRAARISIRP